jgi:sigma-B regulation protein RsbU (phosphoserine phosphatase)
MAEVAISVPIVTLRSQLLDRRRRLEEAGATVPDTEVVRLLQEVDRALERMEVGSYGICEVCRTPIEEDRLLANPLACTCFEHMSAAQLRALERDLDLAVHVQTGLLPQRYLSFGEWESCYHYEPLGAVSGDFCDLSAVDGRLFFLIGDIAGKGVSASLLMSHLYAIFRSLLTVGMPVQELAGRANRVFCESTRPPHYATLVCGFAGQDGEVELVNAGHCPPILIHQGSVSQIHPTGLPVGLFSDGQYPPQRLRLDQGDSLLLYTDGVSETLNAAGEEYGAERLGDILSHNGARSVREITVTCLDDLKRFRAGAPKSDDLTIAAIRRSSTAAEPGR